MMSISPLFHPQELPKTSTSKFHVPFYFYFLTTHWVQSKTHMRIGLSQSLWGHSSKEMWPSLSQQPPRSTPNIFSARGWGLWTTPVSGKCWNEDWLDRYRASQLPTVLSSREVRSVVHSSPPHLPALAFFPFPLLCCILSLVWGGDGGMLMQTSHLRLNIHGHLVSTRTSYESPLMSGHTKRDLSDQGWEQHRSKSININS